MTDATDPTTRTRVAAFLDSRAGFWATVGLIALAIAANVWTVDRLGFTDDLTFLTAVLGTTTDGPGVYDLSAWIGWRYEYWSGRVVPETWTWIFTPAPLIAWRVVSIVVWLGTVLLAVRFFVIARPTSRFLARSAVAIAAFSVIFLMDRESLLWGAFWVTGALYYWWAIPLVLVAVLGTAEVLVARRAPHPAIIVVSSIAALMAGAYTEQISAVVVALGLFATGYRLVQLRRGTAPGGARATAAVIVPTVLSILGAIVLFAAPGNANRAAADERTWLPGFFDAPLSQRLQGGLQFTLEGIVNQSGLLIALVWVAILVIAYRRESRDRVTVGAGVVSVVALTLVVGSAFLGLPRLAQFNPYWGADPTGPEGVLVVVVWTALLIGTALGPLALQRDLGGVIASLLIAAAIAATFVTSFSASMYASGARVHFIPNVALAAALLVMLPTVFRGRRARYVVAAGAPLVVLAGLACIALVVERWSLG
ncbi:hypothetical protein M2152_001949 [Microbacteriaceae bacterium SG_E_30_P1]|uniref:Uncharacterized protein n=1 Tax=Antiquaquibacter oligotrophicus TaxID=2880260 RepID=A0ABT6KRP4_9MICO|nr:DUF6056 family protein [Antiquaquibacter oligotrophicus]MDH6181767.1 hypothetical protein [Antiquaquibacter oligotrophicus]UDF12552.1 hypothetical protein LH407_10355 [Antiquaquibacter oligotrophicus]